MLTRFRRWLRHRRHSWRKSRGRHHPHAHWSRLTWMYHSLPSRYGPNDWILYGIVVVVAVLVVLGGTVILRSVLPKETVVVAGAGGVPVKFVEASHRNGQVVITVEGPSGRREVAVSEDHPLAQQALAMQPGTRINVPRSVLP